MKEPSFLEGVLVALVFALASALGIPALGWLLGDPGPALWITGLGGAYVLYLLARSAERVGRLVTLGAWAVASSLLVLLLNARGVLFIALAQLGMVSLIRALYFQGRPLGLLLDLGLSAVAALVGIGAWLHTGSLFLGVWCLFLIQACFVFLPPGETRDRGVPPKDAFERAHRQAEAALRQLATRSQR